MDSRYILDHKVGYFQVDHRQKIQISALFHLLQEAAIHHANQFQIGTGIMEAKGESWILNRVALHLARYPEFEEAITIRTWATNFIHFKGFRDFRILSSGEEIGRVSTLWLYIDMHEKSFARLPVEIEQSFPVHKDEVNHPDLDRLRLPKPADSARKTSVSLRYSDIDSNQHVNNAAYLDILQTALHHQNLNTHPLKIEIQFAKEISPDTESVDVRLESVDDSICFSLGNGDETAAFGRLK
ncbi:MAG: thioesterase [Verrucomicrobia bacterium]|nr:thioesterase [Verrucomicrobiota bacterium]